MANSVTRLAREIEARQEYLETLLDLGDGDLSEKEQDTLVWLRDNAVMLLADYLAASKLILDAHPLVGALHTVSERDSTMSQSAREIYILTGQWLAKFDE